MATLISARQIDDAAPCGWITTDFPTLFVACTGQKGAMAYGQALKAEIGGTPGTVGKQISFRNGQHIIGLIWQFAPGDVNWNAGTWQVRMNVTGQPGFAGWYWTGLWICRINAACASVATIRAHTGFSIPISNTNPAVYSVASAGIAQPAAVATDEVYVCLRFHNQTGSNGSFTITSDQVLNTPLTPKGAKQLVDGGIVPPQLVDGVLVG